MSSAIAAKLVANVKILQAHGDCWAVACRLHGFALSNSFLSSDRIVVSPTSLFGGLTSFSARPDGRLLIGELVVGRKSSSIGRARTQTSVGEVNEPVSITQFLSIHVESSLKEEVDDCAIADWHASAVMKLRTKQSR